MTKITKLLFVEDGSVDIDKLNKHIEENKLPILPVVYRQGSHPPELVDVVPTTDGGNNVLHS